MNELADFLHAHQFYVPSHLMVLDSNYKRFKRGQGKSSDNGWFIGSDQGNGWVVVTVGDWKTSEKYVYLSKQAQQDKPRAMAQLKKLQDIVHNERIEKQKQAAESAREIFEKASPDGLSPYLVNKKLADSYGCRFDGQDILVPMHNIEGELVGMQRIKPDGKKLFVKGQKSGGAFFMIGEKKPPFQICEGFATAASLFEATQRTTIACFSASNLVSVAEDFSKLGEIIICGDDDYKNELNAGREKALEAANKTGARVFFPHFSGEERGTDFNDLACIEGLDAVRAVFEETPKVEFGFKSLGYNENTHYFYLLTRKQVCSIRKFNRDTIFNLADKSFFDGREDFVGERGGLDYESIANYFIRESEKVGSYQPGFERGVGTWLAGDKLCINTGEELIIDGKARSLAWFETDKVYVNRGPKPYFSNKQPADGKTLYNLLSENFAWQNESDPLKVTGWLATAPLCAALPVRPHLWITGGQGTGKTTLMTEVVQRMLPNFIKASGASTVAGIRQSTNGIALPLVFDEAESDTKQGRERMKHIQEFARLAYSGREEIIKLGGKDGVSQTYLASFSAVFSSINVNFETEADKQRFIVAELKRPTGGTTVQELLRKIHTLPTGEQMFRFMMSRYDLFKKNFHIISEEIGRHSTPREGHTAGVVWAGAATVLEDSIVDDLVLGQILDDMKKDDDKKDTTTEEDSCLGYLLGMPIAQGRHTVASIIRGEDAFDDLGKAGMKWDAEKRRLFVDHKHPAILKHFRDSPWADFTVILCRDANVQRAKVRYCGLKNQRHGIWINL